MVTILLLFYFMIIFFSLLSLPHWGTFWQFVNIPLFTFTECYYRHFFHVTAWKRDVKAFLLVFLAFPSIIWPSWMLSSKQFAFLAWQSLEIIACHSTYFYQWISWCNCSVVFAPQFIILAEKCAFIFYLTIAYILFIPQIIAANKVGK